MKTETLDSLLLDRALGELSPEVRELLDAYLAHEPAHAARAKRLDSTTQLARTAVADSLTATRAVEQLPPWRAPSGPSRFFDRAEIIRLAACLAIGAGVGWLARPERAQSAPSSDAAPAMVATTPSLPAEASRRDSSSFWSVATLARQERARPSVDRASYRLRWDSPAKIPHLEDKP